ncbi:MAG TPA: NAD-dependent epimerase/dehydratase family protein [Actinomycetota bacterium]|nr:NAD-dependent epimerase/dehydratase family protein [Actinomycetota bacterium]
MSQTILVTGGAGFIGSHIVDDLVDLGASVRVLDLLHPAAHSSTPEYLNPAATYVWGDVQSPEHVAEVVDGVDSVCHQASMVGLGTDFADVVDYVRHNDVGTAVLLRALADCGFAGRLVLGSSMVVYGEGRYRCPRHADVRPGPRPVERLEAGRFEAACPICGADLEPEAVGEDAPVDPRNVYAATKLHQEYLCRAYSRTSGVPLTVLRYHNVYGPRMPRDTPYAGVASIFRSALEAGLPPQVFEDGGQVRDFVHVADIARGNVIALTSQTPTEGTFNVCSGVPHSVGEMAAELCRAFGGDIEPVVNGRFRLGDVRHVFASPDRAAEVLGFKAEVSFADGMREFASAPLR